MTLAIITGVSMFFIFIIIGIGYTIYSLISKKNMTGDTKTKALDIFMYLGIAISLIWSVVYLLQIVFSAIDRKFVDVLNAMTYVDVTSGDVRFAIASLIVMFPIYLGLSWYVAKDIKKFHYKQDIMIRKVMIYLTLFITTLSLIGTLVSVIYKYLGGELSISFGLKALAVFVTALSLFWYYYYSLRRDYSIATSVPVIASMISSVVVLAVLIWSVSIIGTPAEMRLKRLDSRRLSDLSSIQQALLNRFQTTDKLPLTLAELNDAFQGYVVPVDPITREEYTYTVTQQPVVKVNLTTNKKEMTSPAIFELCANFLTVREANNMGGGYIGKPMMAGGSDSMYSVSNYYYEGDQSPFWNHTAEKTCFKRVITPDMYYGR